MVKLIKMLAVSLILICTSGAAWADDYAAARRCDYATALKLLRPLAQKDLQERRIFLGTMYEHGVAQDYKEAVRWYRLAAYQELLRR